MVRASKDSIITLKSVEKLMNEPEMMDNVSFAYKRGKIMLSFLLRVKERSPEQEDVEVDVSEFTEGQLKDLMAQYQAYLTFGQPVAAPAPEQEEKKEEEKKEEGEKTSETSSTEKKEEEKSADVKLEGEKKEEQSSEVKPEGEKKDEGEKTPSHSKHHVTQEQFTRDRAKSKTV